MSAYNNKFNKDKLAERNAIAGVLHVLHERTAFTYVHDDNREEEVKIPFYHSLSGDERFLMDQFLNEFDTTKAETQYDRVPRAVVYVDSSGIRSEALTNPHIRLEEVREVYENPEDEEPVLKTFYSLFTSIPIRLNFSVQIKVASHRDLLCVSETLKKQFYKNVRFYYDYGGIRVPGNIAFPEDFERENPIEYGFDDVRNQEINFSLEADTFLPSYNEGTAIFAGNRMATIHNNVIQKNNLNK